MAAIAPTILNSKFANLGQDLCQIHNVKISQTGLNQPIDQNIHSHRSKTILP